MNLAETILNGLFSAMNLAEIILSGLFSEMNLDESILKGLLREMNLAESTVVSTDMSLLEGRGAEIFSRFYPSARHHLPEPCVKLEY
jgi:hypothetical protein